MSSTFSKSRRYSHSFKLQLVTEINEGRLNVAQAKDLYGIRGSSTIYKWLRKFGKAHLIQETLEIVLPDEREQTRRRIKELEDKVSALQVALADEMLERFALQAEAEVARKRIGSDVYDAAVKKKEEDTSASARVRALFEKPGSADSSSTSSTKAAKKPLKKQPKK